MSRFSWYQSMVLDSVDFIVVIRISFAVVKVVIDIL